MASAGSGAANQACQRCYGRKKKCDRKLPKCSPCVQANFHCSFEKDGQEAGLFQVAYVRDLETRVQQLEAQLQACQIALRQASINSSGAAPELSSSPGFEAEANSNSDSPVRGRKRLSVVEDETPESLESCLKQLSLEATAERYLGSSSGVTFARLTQAVLKRLKPDLQPFSFHEVSRAKSTVSQEGDLLVINDASSPFEGSAKDFSLPSKEHACRLTDYYWYHSHNLYPFIRKAAFMESLERMYVGPNEDLQASNSWLYTMWMVFAIGSTTLSSVMMTEESESITYWSNAMSHFDAALEEGNIAALNGILLQISYSFFNQVGPNTWHLVGVAIRIALGMGLHMKAAKLCLQIPKDAQEYRSRLFYSLYMMDRLVSITLGRPFGLRDEDIEIQVCQTTSINTSYSAMQSSMSGDKHKKPLLLPRNRFIPRQFKKLAFDLWGFTGGIPRPILSCNCQQPFVAADDANILPDRILPHAGLKLPATAVPLHILALRKLAGEIFQEIYSNKNRDLSQPDRDIVIRQLHERLIDWRRNMPFPLPESKVMRVPHLSTTWYDLNYHNHVIMLYRPSPLCPVITLERLAILSDSSTSSIRYVSTMHREQRYAFNWLNLFALFTSTLALIYTITAQPDPLSSFLTKSDALTDLNLAAELLQTFSVKFRSALKYHNMVREVITRLESHLPQSDSLLSTSAGGYGSTEPGQHADWASPGSNETSYPSLPTGNMTYDKLQHQAANAGSSLLPTEARATVEVLANDPAIIESLPRAIQLSHTSGFFDDLAAQDLVAGFDMTGSVDLDSEYFSFLDPRYTRHHSEDEGLGLL